MITFKTWRSGISSLLILAFVFEGWDRCPQEESQCRTEITNAFDEAYKNVDTSLARAATADNYSYWWHTNPHVNTARQKSQRAVREAEFRVLPKKWANDFNAYWMPRCGVNQKCVKHMNTTRDNILGAVSIYQLLKTHPHSAMSIYYAQGETMARDFFKNTIDKAFYHAKGDLPSAWERSYWEAKIQQDAATTYETVLKSVTEEMNKKPSARRLMIQIAYVMVFGRYATDVDMNFWHPRSENFREVVEANRNWLYSPNGAGDLNVAVTSILQFLLQKPPTQNEVNNSIGIYKKDSRRLIWAELREVMPKIYY